MPSCNNVLQPLSLCGSGCNTLSHSVLANVDTRKRVFYPLIGLIKTVHSIVNKNEEKYLLKFKFGYKTLTTALRSVT